MKRKSVSYLTEIRKEVNDTLREMMELAIDFQASTEDMVHISPELIRTDNCVAYTEMMQAERALSKAVKNHRLAVKNLKSFF